VLAALYRFLVWPSSAGNDCFILANDEGQARDDLDLAKKLIAANPILGREVAVKHKEIIRRDGRGTLKVLPAQDVAGSHGKTYLFIGFDEIHPYKDYGLFEALSPDPTRRDVLTWITSYNTMRFAPGVPLHDMMQQGRSGADDRMYFSWHAADFTTDPDLAGDDISPEQRANPSMASWDNPSYLDEQRRRLPAHRFRRLHLNLPGMPDGAAFSGEHVLVAVASGRRLLPREAGVRGTVRNFVRRLGMIGAKKEPDNAATQRTSDP
jgi:phage terminase large subunit-like protein